jgi:eukaryotic-like serine/threonine-protein kinase
MKEDLPSLQAALGSRYRLSGELGHGGMATVYLAEDSDTGHPVALKVLRRELTAILGATRFQREIEILTRLRHPRIVPVLDSGDAGDRLYYVMPYISGQSLRDKLAREGPLPLTEVMTLASDIATAVDYAHENGVLHRDIKPENVLLEADRALMCDFGVARAIEVAGSESFSSAGLVVGTPAYMSPEQATGGEVDPRSDVYAFGCVLYEVLAGEPPFTGPTAQAIIARQLGGSPLPLATVRPDLPPGVQSAVFRALAMEPGDRPGSAGLLVSLLSGARR